MENTKNNSTFLKIDDTNITEMELDSYLDKHFSNELMEVIYLFIKLF